MSVDWQPGPDYQDWETPVWAPSVAALVVAILAWAVMLAVAVLAITTK